MAGMDNYMTIYSEVFETILADDQIDCLFNVIWTSPFEKFVEEYLTFYERMRGNHQKTIATWIYGPKVSLIHDMACRLEDLGFPVFSNIETAIKALGVAYQYAIWKKGEVGWRKGHSSRK
jgi:acyl-CoA synthetase (NDP forming)